MSRTRRRNLWLASETGGYAVDPSADGSGYLAVPTESLGDLVDNTIKHETEFRTDREWSTVVETGADGAEIQFEIPVYGNLTAAGDGVDPSGITDDAWDVILEHVFGTRRDVVGEGMDGGGSSGTGLNLDTNDVLSVYDHTMVHQAGTTPPRGQLRTIATDNADSTYVINRAWGVNPGGTAVAYGSKQYRPNQPFLGGNTISVVYRDSNIGTYLLSGGRITSLSITAAVNERLKASITMRFDSSAEDSAAKTSLPATLSVSPVPAAQLRWSPVAFNGSAIDTASVSIDFGLTAAPVKNSDRANGRSDDEMITMAPVVTINPLRTDSVRNLKKNTTQGQLDLQFGSGILGSGYVNCWGITFFTAQVTDGGYSDDEGHARHDLQIMAKDPGPSAPFMQVSRF